MPRVVPVTPQHEYPPPVRPSEELVAAHKRTLDASRGLAAVERKISDAEHRHNVAESDTVDAIFAAIDAGKAAPSQKAVERASAVLDGLHLEREAWLRLRDVAVGEFIGQARAEHARLDRDLAARELELLERSERLFAQEEDVLLRIAAIARFRTKLAGSPDEIAEWVADPDATVWPGDSAALRTFRGLRETLGHRLAFLQEIAPTNDREAA